MLMHGWHFWREKYEFRAAQLIFRIQIVDGYFKTNFNL